MSIRLSVDEDDIADAILNDDLSLTLILHGLARELPDEPNLMANEIAGFGDNLRDEIADAHSEVQDKVRLIVRELFVQLGRPGDKEVSADMIAVPRSAAIELAAALGVRGIPGSDNPIDALIEAVRQRT